MHKLRKYFLSGIALLLPVIITVYILVEVFRFCDGLLGRYVDYYFRQNFGYSVPGLGLLLFLVVVLVAGFIATNFLGKKILHLLERWFIRLPFVAKIYPYAKQFIDFVFGKEKPSFKKVVLVEYPRKGAYSLGFVTNEGIRQVEERTKSEIVTVLIPISPNPFSGFFVFFRKEEVIYLDMKVDEAIKLIVSGGVLQP